MFLSIVRLAAAAGAMTVARARTILSLPKSWSTEDVKRAFRMQALKWHPDRNSSEGARSRFMEARQAYEVALRHTTAGCAAGAGSHASAGCSGTGAANARAGAGGRAGSSSGASGEARPVAAGTLRRLQEQLDKRQRRDRRVERLQRRLAALRTATAAAAAASKESAHVCRLRRGAVLVADKGVEGFFAFAVVLVLRVDAGLVRGVVLGGASGGPVDVAAGRKGCVLLHTKACLAVAPPLVMDDEGDESLFVEELLSLSAAFRLRAHIVELGGQAVVIQGHSEWNSQALVAALRRREWSVASRWHPQDRRQCRLQWSIEKGIF